MKKLLMILFVFCTVSAMNVSGQCYNIYTSNKFDGEYGVCISYNNTCSSTVKVRVTYEVRYSTGSPLKNCADGEWIEKELTEDFNLLGNVRNYWLIGNYGPFHDDCTKRYRLVNVAEIKR